MRVIIVDDEELARGVLREYLRAHADVEVVAECANGFEAVKAIAELEPDVVFLDIQMPKLDGFEVVELAGAKPHYVFATAYDQYALKAFEVKSTPSITCSSLIRRSGWTRRWPMCASAWAATGPPWRRWRPRRRRATGRWSAS
jgi:CheY-like chemotaxis protein